MAVNVVIYDGNPIIDLRNDTVAADKMLDGVKAHAKNGELVIGNIPVVDQAVPTVSFDPAAAKFSVKSVQETGYCEGGTKTVGTSLAAIGTKTYTPGTEDQIIECFKYLKGNQVILGDSDLKAENIVEGVSIFNVAGTAKKKEAAFVELDNKSAADARMYISVPDAVQSAYHDIGGGGLGSAYALLGSIVVIRCGASCSATATSGCNWIMNLTGTSNRVFAFLITSAAAKITVK